MRWSILIGILGIIAGVIFMIASSVPAVAKVVASPFCEAIKEDEFGFSPVCVNDENEQDLMPILIGVGTAAIIISSLIKVFGIVGSLMMMSARMNRILQTGESAQATILDMQHTGVRVNQQPMIKFRLQVQPNYGEIYEAETRRIVPFGMMGRLAIGMVIPVKYDPHRPEDVALDFQSMQLSPISFGAGAVSMPSAASQASLTERLRELEESYQAGLISQEEYEDARRRILGDV
jgi:hypothetical protein